jgi:hypothetical protein
MNTLSTRSRYTPKWVPDSDPWGKAYHPDVSNQICEWTWRAQWEEVCGELRQRERAEILRQHPEFALPMCATCSRHLPAESFHPSIKRWCKDCCEKVWQQMQRNGRERPDECAILAIQKFGYWRTYASRDHIEYKLIRVKRMEFAKDQCEHCGAKDHLSLHHMTYVRIFNELLEDVRILCRSCHSKADIERRRVERNTNSVPADLLAVMEEDRASRSPIRRRRKKRARR